MVRHRCHSYRAQETPPGCAARSSVCPRSRAAASVSVSSCPYLPCCCWRWQSILNELGDQAPVTGALIATGTEQHQRRTRADEGRCFPRGLLRVPWKPNTSVAAPVVDVAKPPLPFVLRTVASSEFGAIPLRIPAANGLISHI